jgi:hypothetical protein
MLAARAFPPIEANSVISMPRIVPFFFHACKYLFFPLTYALASTNIGGMETDATKETQEIEFSDPRTREAAVMLLDAGLSPDEIRAWMKIRKERMN